MTAWSCWSTLAPLPPPHRLPDGYDRHRPSRGDLRDVLPLLLGNVGWGGLPWPGLIDELVRLGRTDVPLSRLAEGHIDALRILDQAGCEPRDGLYGVWASRSQGTGPTGRRTPSGWALAGQLRFASGAGVLDRALVPVRSPSDGQAAFLLDADVGLWAVDSSGWHTEAMAATRSHTVLVDGVVVPFGHEVGGEGFYLDRPGFFPGGIGVAALWVGGAARVADLCRARSGPGPRWGHVRTELTAAHALVRTAGLRLSQETEPQDVEAGAPWQATATEVRAGVANAVHRVLGHARTIAGPAGLAHDPDLGRAIADLDLFVRQQPPDADAEFLGAGA